TFDRELVNKDIISVYIIKSDDEDDDEAKDDNATIFLCNSGAFCNETAYGSVKFNGNQGWYNITINGLTGPKNDFNI
ncbi:MAG: hypothetical protein AABX34_03475, partial [Nanoarchaeota archaeon]